MILKMDLVSVKIDIDIYSTNGYKNGSGSTNLLKMVSSNK